MSEKRYRILFRGKMAEGRHMEEVKRNLKSVFKLSDNKVDQFFTGRQVVVKNNITYESAMRYKMAFETAGAVCKVEEVESGLSMQSSPEPYEKKPSEPSPRQRMTCPKCGCEQDEAEECRQCGIIINKYSAKQEEAVQAPTTTVQIPTTTASPLYFAVSKTKLILMSLCTFGIYEVYWFYKNWELIKERTGKKMRPFWRAMFAIFFCHSLFKSVQSSVPSHRRQSDINPGWLTLGYIALCSTWRLPDPFWLISSLSFLPLLPVQGLVNDINAEAAPGADRNGKFSISNIVVMICCGSLLTLGALEPFVPSCFDTGNGQKAWQEFDCVHGNFTVSFPGKPHHEVQTHDTPTGQLEQQMFFVEDDCRTAYVVVYADIPAHSVEMINLEQSLDAARDGVVASYGGRLTNETRILLGAYPGREFSFVGTMENRRFTGRSRMFLVGLRLYQLAVIVGGQETALDKHDAENFLLSFDLLRV